MSDKTCPSCGADVPSVAKRCRECFHDFTAAPVKSSSNAPLMLLGFLGIMSVVGAVTLGVITTFPLDQKIQVDGGSGYIVTTTQYVSGVQTDRTAFGDIAAVQHIIVGNGTFEVRAIRNDQSSVLILKENKSQKGVAEKYAKIMGKPFSEVDNSTGFFKPEDKAADGS